MIKRHLRELSKSFGSQICPENSEELRRTKTDIENNLSRVLKLITSEDQRKKEDNLREKTELVRLIEDFYNQYQSLYALYGRLTREYMKAPPRRVKRVSSLSSSSSDDTEYFSSDDTELYHSDFNKRISQRGRYSSFVNTLEALKTQKSTEKDEFEAHEMKQLRTKNAELEKAVSALNEKFKKNEEHAMSKTSDLMARINKLEQEAKSLRNNKGKIEEKMKRSRNEALNQKKEFTDQINAMQQSFESVRNNNTELEAHLENEREKVSQYLIQINILEENLAETVTAKKSLLKEKQCFIERIKDLESRCSKENDLEEQFRNAMCEINTLQKQKIELELQNDQSHLEENLAETVTAKQSLLKEKQCFIERIKDLESRCNKENDLEEQLRNSMCEINTLKKQTIELELQNEQSHLEENIAETVSTKQSLLKEKQCFIERIKDLESRCRKENDLEDQLRNAMCEINILQKQKIELEFQNEQSHLEENLAETVAAKQSLLKEKQCFIERIKDLESRCSKENVLEEQLRNATCEINTLKKQKIELELQNEQSHLENLAETVTAKQSLLKEKQCFIEGIKDLESRCSKENDLEEQLRNAMCEINTLQKQKIELELQNEESQKEFSKLNKQITESKMDELAEGYRQKMEDNIHILHRRIHIAEQINNENKHSYKLTKQKYEEENKMLGAKIADYEDEIRTLKGKVWKSEADVSKEGGEKMNLMKTVTRFERKMGKLEKKLKEKDDEMVSLAENKKEAIRQLCFLVDFHRDRCFYLKDLILKMRVKNMK